MNVLYIIGDYYDLNVISQINIVADVDFSIQFLEQVSGAAGGATQHVTSGGNTATNAAEIYDVGSAYDQFLGGEYYEDSLLVQANLVEDANDVRNGDTDTLVSEVIAFTGWDESDNHETDGTHPTVVPGTHDDVMGGVLS
jgi:hypothetical protein